ncbi:hypothetical protein NNO07_18835 [Pseudomonas resinovorans]|uniref:Uncharacterized protein n=1 Tax=Metapseudomonas resinovorans TaxID=53412 RepID=A0ABT4Y8D5_METRE|nr:hypothetical protein [Pseudomonas resinovorans]MDA8485127.1 hypothetical protein [Pseudomonas resinovorans]
MSKRKAHNPLARRQAYFEAILRNNHVAVLDAEASDLQTLINWKNASLITSKNRGAIVDAVCDMPHRWCVYLAALCCDQLGERYMKSLEVEPQGVYLAKHLAPIIETYSAELRDSCNPKHLRGMAWIAIPNSVSLDEAQAARIFDVAGAWKQKEAA